MTPIRLLRIAIRVGLVLVGLAVVYVAITFVQVGLASRTDQAEATDVIVVLGAAQYDGQPSPVLQARLDHSLDLWERDLASAVVVTGGNQEGDRFTEAFSGYEYLKSAGVPEEALFLEVDGSNTYQQLSATALIMSDNGFESALLVSDAYHSKRLQGIAAEVGISEVKLSPAPDSNALSGLVRETAAVSVGRLIGYRRLGNLVG
jgi:vancomycin permeability regulator SanA